MGNDARKWTNKLLDAMQNGMMSPEVIAETAIGFMSEADVEEMCRANDWVDFLGDEDRLDEDELEDDASEYHHLVGKYGTYFA